MWGKYREKFSRFPADHVNLLQGDPVDLPFPKETFDIVLSINGFRPLPEKEKVYGKIFKVLKFDGILLVCFNIKVQSRITVLLVKYIPSKKSWFTPPLETLEEVSRRMGRLCNQVKIKHYGAMVWIIGKK